MCGIVGHQRTFPDALTDQMTAVVAHRAHAGEPCHGTATRLRGGLAGYQQFSPHCRDRIQRAVDEPFSLIVLSTQPMVEAGHGAGAPAVGLFVVDGLHRLLAWEFSGRLAGAARIGARVCG